LVPVWAGIDVGKRKKGFHCALVDEKPCLLTPVCRDSSGVVEWLAKHRPRVVAIDSPRNLAPDGEPSRPCEREFIAAGICNIRYTPDRVTIKARQDDYYEWIEHGLELYEALTGTWRVIECFPTASWTRWHGPRGTLTRAQWSRAALAGRELAGVPARMNQDARDAIAAALTARAHDRGETEEFGDLVVPLEA
jgi:predicted nuclease with RNAse H fold